jgi:hypothetical protein
LQGDVAYNTGLTPKASGVTWNGKQYSADRLPEFLERLRAVGVTRATAAHTPAAPTATAKMSRFIASVDPSALCGTRRSREARPPL